VARYADRLLADGERVALRGRQHVLATLIEGRVAWAIFAAALVLVVLDFQLEPGMVRDVFGWLGLGLLLVALAWLVVIYLNWYNQDYLVTNRRVLKVEGVLNKRSADSSLEKINDAVLVQSIFGRMLGYGDLDILTANEQSVDRYRMLSQAQTFKRTMLDEKHKLEQDVFQIPAPPLRAAPPPAPEPPPAPVPAAAPAQRQMTSDEITGALGDLADLRDRGAISPEEYEAKKQDLLGRL
jgi:PH (Pleckstrin Homology) domain-containing protein/putative oligomerization/nucleic acid binding protein